LQLFHAAATHKLMTQSDIAAKRNRRREE